uniref:Uncharacterized protein n=1 Tax=Romanomermis culicivorax TaxID=13658 RepID=A0A915JC32_ROMCU
IELLKLKIQQLFDLNTPLKNLGIQGVFCGIADRARSPIAIAPVLLSKMLYCCRGNASRVGEKCEPDSAHTPNIGMADSGAF